MALELQQNNEAKSGVLIHMYICQQIGDRIRHLFERRHRGRRVTSSWQRCETFWHSNRHFNHVLSRCEACGLMYDEKAVFELTKVCTNLRTCLVLQL